MTDNEKAVVEAVRERVRMAEGWSKSTGYDAHHYFDTMMDLRRLLHVVDSLTAGTEPKRIRDRKIVATSEPEKPCPDCRKPREAESCLSMAGYQLYHKGPGTRYAEPEKPCGHNLVWAKHGCWCPECPRPYGQSSMRPCQCNNHAAPAPSLPREEPTNTLGQHGQLQRNVKPTKEAE